jgi:hypothetical protein
VVEETEEYCMCFIIQEVVLIEYDNIFVVSLVLKITKM